ncbi:MAG TPA: archaeosortase/exosortase family protein, partial [Candidatus Acidoferrales bacterium]|nr:archaeosortase/exosortase family protein [Candidatus Acidoferrales bacterium]
HVMTTISTEDFYSGIHMNYKGAKTLGMAIVMVAFLVGAFNSIWITNPSILDTDPSTYVIVVMLMSFVFLAFGLKEKLELNRNWKNIAYALAVLVIYFLALSYARVSLSYLFITYRIDALLFPLLLAAIVLAVFGVDGVKRLRYPILYTLFASPLILLPLLGLNQGFALLNSNLIYGILSALGTHVAQSGLMITAPSTTSISISTTCVSLGFFVAMLMFLVPVAYLYEGKNLRKYAFVACGVLLLLLLNVLRMLSLSLVWLYYGLGSAIGAFHLFAGQLLFYAAIVIMLLLAGRFGLSLGKREKKVAKAKHVVRHEGYFIPGLILALLIGIVAFSVSVDYHSAISSPIQLTVTAAPTQSLLYAGVFSSLNASMQSVRLLGANNNGTVFALGPPNGNSTVYNTYVLASVSNRAVSGSIVGTYNSTLSSSALLLRNGITVKSALVAEGNNTATVSYYALPYNISGGYTFVNYEFITLYNSTAAQSCGSGDSGAVEQVQSAVYNLFASGTRGSPMNCAAELVAAAAHR